MILGNGGAVLTAQETLFQTLKTLLASARYPKGISASELEAHTGLKRSVLSLYLNQLVSDSKLTKTNTRPVRFSLPLSSEKTEVFRRFIGYSGSHLQQIAQCKSAVMYPPDGLPIIITGDSGVGKSYLASLIYAYAVQQNVIETNAPFIELNCADYANNPELLSSILFGHVTRRFYRCDSI